MRSVSTMLLLLLVPLAGCMGGGPSDVANTPNEPPAPTEPIPKVPEVEAPPVAVTECNSDDPKYHTHDSWGLRESYVLYDGSLELGYDTRNEMAVNAERARLGVVTFTPETDGDDDGADDKTDIVYQGTGKITVRLSWTESNSLPGVRLFYKHASTPEFAPVMEGAALANGEDYDITLRERWSDLAHTSSVSRWAFQLEAYDPQQSLPFQAHVGRGSVEIYMEIHKGQEPTIDPPHPPFFCNGPNRYAGEINGSVGQAIVVNADSSVEEVRYGSRLTGYKMDQGNFVPWETTKLKVWLYYNYTGSLSAGVNRELGLMYHAADSPEYQYPTVEDKEAGLAYYEIEVDGTMTDSPYAFETLWEFGVYPILNGQAGNGDFQGNFHIYLVAVNERA